MAFAEYTARVAVVAAPRLRVCPVASVCIIQDTPVPALGTGDFFGYVCISCCTSYAQIRSSPESLVMRQQAFLQWLGQLDRLTPRQRRQVSAKLNTILPKHTAGSDTATLIPPPDHCPHCLASALRPWGTSHGLARYRCKQCGRTCNALSGTALARLRHKDHWPNYATALIQGESVRMAAQRCGVDKNTAFRWRHRFLRDAADHRAEQEAGIVEADETFFLESFKGQRSLPRPARSRGGVAHKRGINAEQIPVLVVRDRQGRTADFKLARLDAEHVQAVLAPLVARDAVLCTDSAGVYAAFARRYGITHRTINVRHGRRVL